MTTKISHFNLSQWSRRHWIIASLFVALIALIISIVPGMAKAVRESAHASTELAIELPKATAQQLVAPIEQNWETVRVKSGETLSSVFQQQGIAITDMYRVLEAADAKGALRRIRAGAELGFRRDTLGKLTGFYFNEDESKRVELALNDAEIKRMEIDRPLQRRVLTASGTITNSLYVDGEKAGLSPATIIAMAKALQFDIDFGQDLRVGDRFQLIYEELWRDGERIGSGDVLAVNFVNQGKPYIAVLFEYDGRMEYFDRDGRPTRKEFMRTPIEFARLSSRFGARRHPVLGRMKMHKGVDYAAGSGTPIMAAGNGRIAVAGWHNGYGRNVVIDHGQGITTLYAHMSRFGKFRSGQRVRQGEIIGYVGSTGMSTGPHLHYEFRVKGVHRNPLTVTLPKPEPIKGKDMARFQQSIAPVIAQLQMLDERQLAMN